MSKLMARLDEIEKRMYQNSSFNGGIGRNAALELVSSIRTAYAALENITCYCGPRRDEGHDMRELAEKAIKELNGE